MGILLVEDDVSIRDLLTDELSVQGFEVCVAAGDKAAALVEAPPTPFSLLITDIHMPGRLSGLDLGRLLRRRHRLVPIIDMTGRPDALAALASPGPWEAVLLKPFSPSALIRLIRRLPGSRIPPLPRDVMRDP